MLDEKSGKQPVPQIQNEQSFEASLRPVVLPIDFIAQLKKGNATPSVRNLIRLRAGGVAVTITDFKEGQDGQSIEILGDGFTDVANNAKIVRASSGVLVLNRVYKFTKFGSRWHEHVASTPGVITAVTPILRGISWSNRGSPVDLLGQTKGVTPKVQVNGTITGCKIIGQGIGDAVIGVKKAPNANYAAGLVDITGGADATITANDDAVISIAGWNTTVTLGDAFEFELKSVSVFTQVAISLEITPV